MDSNVCRCCSTPLAGNALTLWDGRTYCRDCVQAASPALHAAAVAGKPLCERLEPRQVSPWKYFRFVGGWLVISVLVLFGMPLGLGVVLGNVPLEILLLALGFFGCAGLIFLGLPALLNAVIHRRSLPREISIADGVLTIVTPHKTERVPLASCKWLVGGTAADEICLYTGLRRGVMIQTPEAQFAIGHEPGNLDRWRSFLLLAELPRSRQLGCLWWFMLTVLGLTIGAALGAALGQIAAPALNQPMVKWSLAVLGAIDGVIAALMYASCTSEGAEAARKRMHPALIGLTFMAIGLKVGIGGNWHMALIGSGLNGVLGLVIAGFCRSRIRAAEDEDELAIARDAIR